MDEDSANALLGPLPLQPGVNYSCSCLGHKRRKDLLVTHSWVLTEFNSCQVVRWTQ